MWKKKSVLEGEEEEKRSSGPTMRRRVRERMAVAARGGATAGGASPPCCQAEKCVVDLTDAKRYHRRHKVCEFHAKAPVVIVAGRRQRFCQQCSR
ncbi:hypothetical protein Nepgr_016188 [Nepenthes gracilis]|uniref:SBP-type domain-containing protein n=1 Tax=Nepenthes gracilis TaxID=150966 RepID=A0AAD3SNN5_NEPGR|nr:hypothetical protein Nepgr_016188 [Nepenthes gracilis]